MLRILSREQDPLTIAVANGAGATSNQTRLKLRSDTFPVVEPGVTLADNELEQWNVTSSSLIGARPNVVRPVLDLAGVSFTHLPRPITRGGTAVLTIARPRIKDPTNQLAEFFADLKLGKASLIDEVVENPNPTATQRYVSVCRRILLTSDAEPYLNRRDEDDNEVPVIGNGDISVAQSAVGGLQLYLEQEMLPSALEELVGMLAKLGAMSTAAYDLAKERGTTYAPTPWAKPPKAKKRGKGDSDSGSEDE